MMNIRRTVDWKFCIALSFLLAVSTFCWNSVQAGDQVQSLIRIADTTTSQSERNGDEIEKLRLQLDDQARVSHDRAVRDQAQNRALIQVLRKAGLDVPPDLVITNPPTSGGGTTSGPKAGPGGHKPPGKPSPTPRPPGNGADPGTLCETVPMLCGLQLPSNGPLLPVPTLLR